MAQENQLEAIQRDLECPQCQYNLRGLHGVVVNCPECGHICDIAWLIAGRWKGAWWTVPGFSTLEMPAAWTAMGFVGAMIVGPIIGGLFYSQRAVPLLLVLMTGWLVWWGWLMWRVHRWWPQRRAVHLALGAHLMVFAWFVGLALSGLGLFLVIYALNRGHNGQLNADLNRMVQTIAGFLSFGAASWIFWMCKRSERRLAEVCIKRYIAGKAD